MKSSGSSRKFPNSTGEIAAVVAQAPGKDRKMTAREVAKWRTGVMVDGGGYAAVRKAVATKRSIQTGV